jgi:predicted nucleic acid-binding protein
VKVVDANVAVKWHVSEPGDFIAESILESKEVLLAPAIIRLEVLNAIVRCVRDKRSSADEAGLRCEAWLAQLKDREIILCDEEELLKDAISLGISLKHSVADCLYLAACRRFDATLLTFDEELSKRAKLASIKCELLKEPVSN